jgi:glycosyltransferase involved in cell wall biosynthesis
MIRVLHIDTGRVFRGGQRQVNLLIRCLSGYKIEQYLACPSDSPLPEKVSACIKGCFNLPRTNLKRFLARRELLRFVTENQIDIIHAHDSHAHTLATFSARGQFSPRLIVTRRSSGRIGFGSRTKYLARDIRFIAISGHIKEMLLSGGVPNESIHVISSMIDLELYKAGIKPLNSGGSGKKVIISAGAFDKKKGYSDAVRAMRHLKSSRSDFIYRLYGEGGERVKLLNYIKRHGLEGIVFLPGWHGQPEQYLRGGDIFLSTSYQEGLNMSIVEAMAAGVPVVATDIPAHRENIRDGETGLLFPAGRIDKMSEKLAVLLEDKNLAKTLTANAMKVAARYDCEKVTGRVYQLYGETVARTS